MELILYTVANGYNINTTRFRLSKGVTGEYDGRETAQPQGKFPLELYIISPPLRKYLEETAPKQSDSIKNNDGRLVSFLDKITSKTDTVPATDGLCIRCDAGLKTTFDKGLNYDAGLFDEEGEESIRVREATIKIAQNNCSTVSTPFTQTLNAGKKHRTVTKTLTTAINRSHTLKNGREVKSDFFLQSLHKNK